MHEQPPNLEPSTDIAAVPGAILQPGIEQPLAQMAENPFAVQEDSDLLDEWADTVTTPESTQESVKRDMMAQYYIQGLKIPQGEDMDGITAEDMRSWHETLSETEREDVEVHRALQAAETRAEEQARERLGEQAPELLEGKLPADMAALIDGRYILGSNQSLGVLTVEDAAEHLTDTQGIDLNGHRPDQRFLFFTDEESTGQELTRGYYGAEMAGRFVTATPMLGVAEKILDTNAPNYAVNNAYDSHLLPPDYTVIYQDAEGRQHEAVNSKYVAGFIDVAGDFNRNSNFMKSGVANLAPEADTNAPTTEEDTAHKTEAVVDANEVFESQVQQFVQGLHERAEAEKRDLSQDEVQQIKSLVQVVQQRRGATAQETVESTGMSNEKNTADDEVVMYMKDNGIEIKAASERYEAEVQQFVQGLRERAEGEGRALNAGEIKRIKDAAETVKDLRSFTARAA